MPKILTRLTTAVLVVTSLGMLITVSSCVTSASAGRGRLEAVLKAFPSVTDMTELTMSQNARISGHSGKTKVSEIKGPSGLLGYCAESEVIGRSGPFWIRVLLDPQLYVRRVAVISYPWAWGRDVCRPAFTSQFKGKGPQDSLRIGKDIDAMTRATISSRVMAQGVRNSIKVVKLIARVSQKRELGIYY